METIILFFAAALRMTTNRAWSGGKEVSQSVSQSVYEGLGWERKRTKDIVEHGFFGDESGV